MRKTVYIEVHGGGVYVYPPGFAARGRFSFLPPDIVLVVNSPQAVTRVAAAGPHKLNDDARWALVREAFPLGRALNVQSHVFDGCVYEAPGGAVFFMAALPLAVSEEALRAVAAHLRVPERRVTRLETVEAVLFRRFCGGGVRREEAASPGNGAERALVFFPCDGGVKALAIDRGVPQGVHYLPLAEEIKDGALRRALAAGTPEEVILLTRPDWGADWYVTRCWLAAFFAEEKVRVRTVDF